MPPKGHCLKGNCSAPERMLSDQTGCFSRFKGEAISSPYKGRAVAPLGPISGVSSSGEVGGNLPADNPGSPGSKH